MFGFGRSKCRQCGDVLESMEAVGDRIDDLRKSSILGNSGGEKGICARCRAVNAAGGSWHGPQSSVPPTSAAVPRAVAQVNDSNAAQSSLDGDAEAGGRFQTASGVSEELEKITSVAAGSGLGPILIWLITTKTGRNVAAVIFFLFVVGLQTCSDDSEDLPYSPSTSSSIPADYRPPDAPIANPVGNPGAWVTSDDYPASALAEQRQGTAQFNLVVNRNGHPEICTIIRSSSHTDLDKATCDALMKRARFDGHSGGMALRNYSSQVHWKIPDE